MRWHRFNLECLPMKFTLGGCPVLKDVGQCSDIGKILERLRKRTRRAIAPGTRFAKILSRTTECDGVPDSRQRERQQLVVHLVAGRQRNANRKWQSKPKVRCQSLPDGGRWPIACLKLEFSSLTSPSNSSIRNELSEFVSPFASANACMDAIQSYGSAATGIIRFSRTYGARSLHSKNDCREGALL